MTEVNVELLQNAVEWAQHEASKPVTDPTREWDQGSWTVEQDERAEIIADLQAWDEMTGVPHPRYGTEGYDAWQKQYVARADEIKRKMLESGDCKTSYCIAGYVGKVTGFDFSHTTAGIQQYATEKLGITENQAEALFHSDNTIHDVEIIADGILRGESFNGI